VEPIQYVAWTQEKWSDALALYKDVLYSIQQAIEAIDPNISSAATINQYDYAALSAGEKALVLKEKQASESFEEYVFGSSSSLSIDGIKLRKAYLALSNIAGAIDARTEQNCSWRQGIGGKWSPFFACHRQFLHSPSPVMA